MSTVYTIGYEGTDIDRFLETLLTLRVEVLADVRAVALSRKKGFSKGALSGRCEEIGVRYEHLVDLGDPKDGREAARSGRYDDFRQIYEAHLALDSTAAALKALTSTAARRTTCLMCFERDPLTCHRSLVGERLRGRGFKMVHLFGDSPGRYRDHAAQVPGLDPGQGAATA
jgi:uncharacterized protein (DUF488 family)